MYKYYDDIKLSVVDEENEYSIISQKPFEKIYMKTEVSED